MPRTHLYATLVGVGFLDDPSVALAPVAICHAFRLEVATASSRGFGLETGNLGKGRQPMDIRLARRVAKREGPTSDSRLLLFLGSSG